MIEIFKTNVQTEKQADEILIQLLKKYPNASINFDLEDSDKILRVDATKIFTDEIIEQLNQANFECEVLP